MYLYLRHMAKGYVFTSVGLCVCLSVSNIVEKHVNKFSWNFKDRWDFVQGTIWMIFGMFCLTPGDSLKFFIKQDKPSVIVVVWCNGGTALK